MNTLKPLRTLTYPPAGLAGQRARLFPATIMTPDQVQAGMPQGQQSAAEQLRGRWMLCGDVDRQMFKLLMSSQLHQVGHRVSAFTSPNGSGYALFTHQVDSFQHRFVLPLWSDEVRRYLDAAAREPYGFMLGDDGDSAAWVLPGVATAEELAPLRELCLSQPAMSEELLAELSMAVVVLSAPNAIPSVLEHSHVEVVSLSVVVPSVFEVPGSAAVH